jgi:hypothetical protein
LLIVSNGTRKTRSISSVVRPQWFGELGSAVADGGAAMGAAKTVGRGGSVSDGGSRGLTGYSIVSVDDLDSAVELAKSCPVLEIGGAVDVYEAIAM